MYKNAQEYIEAYEKGEVKDLNDFPKYIDDFIYKVCNRYLNVASIDELYQMSWVFILESIDKYDSTKGSGILSFVEYSIEKGILRYIRSTKTHVRRANSEAIYLDNYITQEDKVYNYQDTITYKYDNIEDEAIYNNAKELYFKYTSKQKDKIKTILNLTFYNYTQSEIAEIIGTTRSYVQKTLRDHRVKLRKLILENETLKSKAF